MRLADVELTHRDGVVIARLRGEVDMSNVEDLGAALASSTPVGARGVVVDMSEVDYLDSAGIRMIYRLGERLRARGVALRLVIPARSPVSETLRLAGIASDGELADSVAESLAKL